MCERQTRFKSGYSLEKGTVMKKVNDVFELEVGDKVFFVSASGNPEVVTIARVTSSQAFTSEEKDKGIVMSKVLDFSSLTARVYGSDGWMPDYARYLNPERLAKVEADIADRELRKEALNVIRNTLFAALPSEKLKRILEIIRKQ